MLFRSNLITGSLKGAEQPSIAHELLVLAREGITMREYVEQIQRQSNSVSRFASTLKLKDLACGRGSGEKTLKSYKLQRPMPVR